MCVIYYKPAKKELIDIKVLENMWENNPHGIGLAFQERGKVFVMKGIMNFEDLITILKYFEKEIKNKNLVIHFRLASKGELSLFNTHPFVIDKKQPETLIYYTKKAILFHNGTLSRFGNGEKSDTRELAEWLGNLGKLSICKIVEILDKIGNLNKFLVMSPRNIYMIGNWEEKDGQYFSNLYFERPKIIYYNSNINNFEERIWRNLYGRI